MKALSLTKAAFFGFNTDMAANELNAIKTGCALQVIDFLLVITILHIVSPFLTAFPEHIMFVLSDLGKIKIPVDIPFTRYDFGFGDGKFETAENLNH